MSCTRFGDFGYMIRFSCTRFGVFGYMMGFSCTRFGDFGYMMGFSCTRFGDFGYMIGFSCTRFGDFGYMIGAFQRSAGGDDRKIGGVVDEKVYERYVDVVVFAPNLDFSQQAFFDNAI